MIPAPTIEFDLLSPVLIIAATAVLGVLVEAFWPRKGRFVAQAVLALAGVVAAFCATIWVATLIDPIEGDIPARGQLIAERTMTLDGPTLFAWGAGLIYAALSLGLFAERRLENGLSGFTSRAADAPGSSGEREATALKVEHTEVFPLASFALLGMMIFVSAHDLLMMFIALEVLSLPLYVLCALSRRRRVLSQEAALKYFLLGAFASGFFIYGVALIYGYAGSLDLAQIDAAVTERIDSHTMLLIGVGLVCVGLLFKIGAVPFHAWTPDAYQGAPTSVTAFMAAATKAAAILALARLLYVGLGGAAWDWLPLIWVVAILTMVFGSIVMIAQTDVKRMLAYSSIAHAGFLLVPLASLSMEEQLQSIAAIQFYLLGYGVATIGAFAVVSLIRDADGEATHLSSWVGLGKEAPLIAGAFALFLLSFAGIPLTAGFMGKWTAFTSAWAGEARGLVFVGIASSILAAYVYVRIVVLMFFTDPVDDTPRVATAGITTQVVIALSVVGTLVLGILPGPALELAQQAGAFIR